MNGKLMFILFVFITLVILLACVPYKQQKEKFEIDIGINKMSCKDYLATIPEGLNILNQVQGNEKRLETLDDMERGVISIYTSEGVKYTDSDHCVIRKEKVPLYKMNLGECRLDAFRLTPTTGIFKGLQPEGCFINPRSDWFLNFLDTGYYYKHKYWIDELNELKAENKRLKAYQSNLEIKIAQNKVTIGKLESDISSLSSTRDDLKSTLTTKQGELSGLQQELNSLKSVTLYEHCNFQGWQVTLGPGRYDLLQLNNLGVKNDLLSAVRVSPGTKIELYTHTGFTGPMYASTSDITCLTNVGMNDTVSSIVVS
uniref:Beta/gamma crystallin 'Greek key' domain-containing protein n=1 Tax=viral metagenome TaxID=1070528 RepID=A0A6C0BFI3_9ZZZZ